MKYKNIISIVLLILSIITIMSCTNNQIYPNVILNKTDNYVFSWDKIDNVKEYEITLNNKTIEKTIDNSYTFTPNICGTYSLGVKGIYNNKKETATSKIIVVVTKKTLDTPFITINENVISWDSIIQAESYKIFLNGEYFTTTTKCEYVLDIDYCFIGKNEIFIVSSSNQELYQDSLNSNNVYYIKNN